MSAGVGSKPHGGYSVSIRIQFCIVVVAVVVFGLATVLYNLPSSTVKSRLAPAINAVIEPWFEQDWRLFAPTPSTFDTHLLVAARIEGNDGVISETSAWDVQFPIEDFAKSHHILPTRLAGVTLAAQEQMADYAAELAAISTAQSDEQNVRHAQLDERYQPVFDALSRFLSRCAQDRFSGKHIVAVRGTFTATSMTPFSARNDRTTRPLRTKVVVATSWDPFIPDVADMAAVT